MPRATTTAPGDMPKTWNDYVNGDECSQCGGKLKTPEGSFSVVVLPSGLQRPACRACKLAAMPAENERRKRGR